MNYTALSLSQTPPLSVPLPYFLAAPFFAAVAALLLLGGGPELLATRWSPAMLALTHLLTLGFLGTVMLGALQQLVPVLIGVPLPAARVVAWMLFPLWLSGTSLLIAGMGTATPVAVEFGGSLLFGLIVVVVSLVARSLWCSRSRHATLWAMALAGSALVIAAALALHLIFHFGGQLPLAHPLTRLHIGWASIGWVLLLLIGVAYQVVPMFQITPEYPLWQRRWLVRLIWLGLVAWSLQGVIPVLALVSWLLAAGVVLFALQTLRLQAKRRRKLADVTLDFWRLAMGSLLMAVVVWSAGRFVPGTKLELLLGLLFFIGFAVSAVNGMLYKIVPFLIWLHLNNRLQQTGRRQGGVPNMKQVIPDRHARWQFRLQVVALLLLAAPLLIPAWPVAPGALVWLGSSLLLGWNLFQALRLFMRIARETPS